MVLLTPRGRGGVAVVGFAGPGRVAVVESLLRSPAGHRFAVADGSVPQRAVLWGADGPVDQVLVVVRAGRIEVHVHGAPSVLDWLERTVGPWSEASRGRLDELARGAISQPQLALALEQRAWCGTGWLQRMAELAPEARGEALRAARRRTEVAEAHCQPARIVLSGAQNAGKSTLMNRLLFRERVLVGGQRGLTRDPVRELTELAGYPYEVIDTAGEGPAESSLDRAALDLARRARRDSLCLVVVDGAVGPGPVEAVLAREAVLWVRNKSDLPQAPWLDAYAPWVAVSCLDEVGGPEVRLAIGDALRRIRGLPEAGPVGGPAALENEQRAMLDALG